MSEEALWRENDVVLIHSTLLPPSSMPFILQAVRKLPMHAAAIRLQ
jgi:hypothetical protein